MILMMIIQKRIWKYIVKFCWKIIKRFFKIFLFRDDLFKKTCEKIRNKNETIIVQNTTRLIVFSTKNLTIYDVKHFTYFYETVNENWNNTIEYENIFSQSNYSIEFERFAFIQKQLNKFKFFVNEFEFKITIYFIIITRMYFSFFICEIKCDVAVFDFTDRQNAQNMNVVLKNFVVLFKYVKREKELNRKIFIFFISHDHKFVKIYDRYFVIESDKINFYRHSIYTFDFTTLNDKKKWIAYKFVKNVYDHHSLKLHKLICSTIDDLSSDISFDLSQSASFSQSTSQNSQQSNTESMLSEDDSHLSFLNSQDVTPNTSSTHTNESAFKKPKNQRADEQRRWNLENRTSDIFKRFQAKLL